MAQVLSARSWALAGIVAVMIVWGSTFVVTKAAVHEIPPFTLAALRFAIAALVLVPAAIARGGLALLPRPIPFRRLALMALTGVVGFTVLFNYALLYGSASQGALIFAFAPAAIALGAVLVLAESPSKRRVAGIVASVLGVVLVVAGGEATAQARSPLLGGLCMIGSVASWTVYTVLAKGLAKADQIVVTALVSVAGALLLLPGAAIELALGPWPQVSLQGWLGTVFLGLIASALTYVVYGRALRELDASLVGVFSNLDPIVGVLTAVLLLDERLYAGQMLGGAITLFGMWLASSRQGEAPPSRSV